MISDRNPIKRETWILLIVCAIVMLPFLGLADFNTKGEPREAVVAYSILDSGNWILPTNNGGEMPYKPPFFHWCIAAASLLNGGHVTEFTSRLPSAIALIAMTVWTFVFFARRRDTATAMATALITFTTFELHRAGANCRVDMVLTAATVGAIYSLYSYFERGMKGVPWLAILMMSIGTLTKGPVGMVIPCLVAGIFMLMRKVNFFKAFFLLSAWGLMSLILPACWYVAAYARGGQEFLDLVMEENFGRMTSTMSYDSCVNPWPYNIATLLGGFVPWTLAVLMSVVKIRVTRQKSQVKESLKSRIAAWYSKIPALNVFAATAAITIFIFYCIPQSKRSVYLMPMYPFTAYFVAMWLLKLCRDSRGVVKAFGDIIAAIAVLLPVCFIAVKCGAVPESLFSHGRHAVQNLAMLHSLAACTGTAWIGVAVSAVGGILWWVKRRELEGTKIIGAISGVIMTIYISMAAVYQPAVLNVKSQKGLAADIERIAPAGESKLYEFIAEGEFAKGDPIHFFEVNFYTGDRMSSFYKLRPTEGFLLVGDDDSAKYFPQFESEGYDFTEAYRCDYPLKGQKLRLWRFNKK